MIKCTGALPLLSASLIQVWTEPQEWNTLWSKSKIYCSFYFCCVLPVGVAYTPISCSPRNFYALGRGLWSFARLFFGSSPPMGAVLVCLRRVCWAGDYAVRVNGRTAGHIRNQQITRAFLARSLSLCCRCTWSVATISRRLCSLHCLFYASFSVLWLEIMFQKRVKSKLKHNCSRSFSWWNVISKFYNSTQNQTGGRW